MDNQDIRIKRLAEDLKRLAGFVPTTKDELKQWYEQAWDLEAEHLKGGDYYLNIPHFLWHYFSDADIRMKDEVYAEVQNRRIDLVIQHLERGVMPSDEDTYL